MDSYRRKWMAGVVKDQASLNADSVAADELLNALLKHCWPTKTNQNT